MAPADSDLPGKARGLLGGSASDPARALASVIDHTLLRPDAARADIEGLCPGMGVNASGGIRDIHAALEMIEAGASRIGTSSGAVIVSALCAG